MTITSRVCRLLAVLGLGLALSGCMVHQHRVGSGPVGLGTTTARQYYILFGFIQLNEVDTQRFTEDSVSYDIYTEFSMSDFFVTTLLLPFTVTTRTVTVER